MAEKVNTGTMLHSMIQTDDRRAAYLPNPHRQSKGPHRRTPLWGLFLPRDAGRGNRQVAAFEHPRQYVLPLFPRDDDRIDG